MAFDLGFDFRASGPYVTDPAYGVCVLAEAYPHTYTASNGYSINAGFIAGTTGAGANRSATNDPRIAGMNYDYTAAAGLSFHVDLSSGSAPGAGAYTIDLACGDVNQSRGYATIKVKDNTTDLISLSGTTGAANKYFDATGAVVTATTTWTGATASKTFASTTAYLNTTVSSDIGCIAHFRLTLQASGAPYTLTADVGALSLSANTSTRRANRRLTAAVGPVAMTGRVAGLRATRRLVAAKGTHTLTGVAMTPGLARRLIAAAGTATLTGVAATIRRTSTVFVGAPGGFTLTPQTARLRYAPAAAGDYHHERRDTAQPFRRHYS